MKSWKRNVLIAGVLVLACAGVYLNWFYGRSSTDLTKTLDVDKLMGESTLVLSDTNEPAAAAAAAAADGAESFAAMRLSRQTARDEAVALLQETPMPRAGIFPRATRSFRESSPTRWPSRRSRAWSLPRAMPIAWPTSVRTASRSRWPRRRTA